MGGTVCVDVCAIPASKHNRELRQKILNRLVKVTLQELKQPTESRYVVRPFAEHAEQ